MKVAELRASLAQFGDDEDVTICADYFYRRYPVRDIGYSEDGRACITVSGREWQDYVPKAGAKKGVKTLRKEAMIMEDENRSLEDENSKLRNELSFCQKRIAWLERDKALLAVRVRLASDALGYSTSETEDPPEDRR